jgi:hypothetical protein
MGATGNIFAQAASPAPSPAAAAATTTAAKDTSTPVGAYESRAELERLAVAAEKAGRTSEAWLLRYRLKNGDFQEGDRILLRVENVPGMSDTLIVRRGKHVEFQNMADLSLDGVLRAELTDTLRQHLSKYVHNPVFRVTPLLPLVIIGKVGSPGYYYMSADAVFRDVLNRARISGGSDLNKITIRRDAKVIWKPEDVRVALNDGLSIDRLHLRAGDEVSVGGGKGFGLNSILPWVTTGLTVYVAYSQLQGRKRR